MLLMQLTAAHGPAECELAVQLSLRELQRACERANMPLEVLEANATPHGYQSLLLRCPHPLADLDGHRRAFVAGGCFIRIG